MERDFENKRTVLVVEDELVNSQLLGFILSEDYNVLYAEDGKKALDILSANIGRISMVLTDIKMPVMGGFELIRQIKAEPKLSMIPIMVLTSEPTYEEKSLQLGAIDFLTKPYDMPTIILSRVRRIIELSEGRMIIERTEKDFLTDLYSREFFLEYASRLQQNNADRSLDAVVLDIDRFHLVNELYGQEFGNRVLQKVASSIQKFLSSVQGIGSRYEKDIFYMLLEHQESYDSLLEIVDESLRELDSPITISVRLGVYPDVDRKLLPLQQFDRARNASNRIRSNHTVNIGVYDSEVHKSELLKERLLHEFANALERKQFIVMYQPKFSITGENPRFASSEALVRWKHPELGMISPGIFIPLLEQNGMIPRLDFYVEREAAGKMAEWKKKYGISLPVSVNVSRYDLFDRNLADKLLGILKESGLSFDEFFLEVTESAYSDDALQLIDSIRTLKSAGFKIEMDDFGSGYSSLNRLSKMPIDILKLDMSFTRSLQESPVNERIVELIVSFARSLESPVIAEGVETEEQYRILKRIGCSSVQGFFFSRPLSDQDFEAFIENRVLVEK